MSAEQVIAWRPSVPGVTEVFHARFTDHCYPMHTHDAWTLLILDEGAVTYDLDHHSRSAVREQVTILPPHVPHDGRAATRGGFRKRVVYLDEQLLGSELTGAAVDHPGLHDARLRSSIARLHDALAQRGDEFAAQSQLALVRDRLRTHLGHPAPVRRKAPKLAERLRELLDANVVGGVALDDAARQLQAEPASLVRGFARAYGLPPHRYLIGRRVDLARGLLLAGMPPAEVAQASGFYDQPHLTRHYRRLLGTTPGRYRVGKTSEGSFR